MNNLIIALLAIGFAAMIMVSGISYIDSSAITRQTEAANNKGQVETLVTDYNNLRNNVGHRPTAADYQNVFASSSVYSFGAAGSGSGVAAAARLSGAGGSWKYMPSCGGGTQDCFCLTVTNQNPALYKAAHQSAMGEMTNSNSSRIEYSSSTCDDSQAVTDPHAWAAAAPSSQYYLTLRLNGGSTSAASTSAPITYSPSGVYQYVPACGPTIANLVSWTCVSSTGATVPQTYCTPPAPSKPAVDYSCISYYAEPTGYGACVGGVQQLTGWDCVELPSGAIVSQGNCGAPASTRTCSTGTGTTGTGTTSTGSGGSGSGGGGTSGGTTGGGSNTSFTYSAQNVAYGTCTASCGVSTEPLLSTWTCLRSDGTTVAQSFCNGPAPTQGCTSVATCQVANATYTACNTTCGTGTQHLSGYECHDGSGNLVPESDCTAPPATQSCTSTSTCSYTASNIVYGSCAPACGSSTQTPSSVNCLRSDGVSVNSSFCIAAGVMPGAVACNNYSLCVSSGTYGTCANACGASTQPLVSYACLDTVGGIVDSSHCTAPANTKSCTSTATCQYTAQNVTYGTCSASCGTSTKPVNSTWTCLRSDGVTVAQSFCQPPTATQSCTDFSQCQTTGVTYSACSNTCGAGTEHETGYSCVDAHGNPVPIGDCTAPGNQSCVGTTTCTYGVHNVTYTACAAACGSSTQTLNSNWTCVRSDGVTVAQSFCTPPVGTESCTNYSLCSATNITYGNCSTTCGSGSKPVSSFSCVDTHGNTVLNADCPTPAAQACSSTTGCTYAPASVTYGTCAAACGTSSQTLNAGWTCKRSDGTTVAQSFCTPPAATESCNSYSLCTASNVTYGACQTTCGSSTAPVASFTCKDTQGHTVANSECTTPAPQACSSYTGCSFSPQNITYSACPAACGSATQTLNAGWTCQRSDGTTVAQSNCTPPAASETCFNYSLCTASNITYGACPTTCGTANEPVASFTCKDTHGYTVPNSECTTPTGPACSSYTGCGYTPQNVTYGTCAAACGTSSAPVNAGWTCLRSDGTTVAQSVCIANHATPAASQTCSSYSSCTYQAENVTYGTCAAACGASTQPLNTSWTCLRSDGTSVPQATCTANGQTPAPTIACTSTDTCVNYTYSAIHTTYGACAAADCDAQSNIPVNYQCQQNPGGAIVANSFCEAAGTAPPAISCTYSANCYSYTASNPTYCSSVSPPSGTCTLQYQCERSDGNFVPPANQAGVPLCGVAAAQMGWPTAQPCTSSSPVCSQ